MSLPMQSPFNHQSVILFLKHKSINYAVKDNQTIFKHTFILIFAVLTLLAIVCSVYYKTFLKIQNVSRVNCPQTKLNDNCTAKRYFNCNTFWSSTCALIMIIPLCNCCDLHVNWKCCFMLRKQ